MAVITDDDKMDLACSQLVQNLGGAAMINAEMQQLVAALQAGDVKAMNDSMESLNVLLMAPVDDPDLQLELEPQVWVGLLEQLQRGETDCICLFATLLCFLARGEGDLKTMRNIMITAQRLAEQGKSNPDGYRGAWYYSQHLVRQFMSVIGDGYFS